MVKLYTRKQVIAKIQDAIKMASLNRCEYEDSASYMLANGSEQGFDDYKKIAEKYDFAMSVLKDLKKQF